MPFLPYCSRPLQHCSALSFKHVLTKPAPLSQILLGLWERQPCPAGRVAAARQAPDAAASLALQKLWQRKTSERRRGLSVALK